MNENNVPGRPWSLETKKIEALNKELHSAIKSKDPKQILAVQLKMIDYYGMDRVELLYNIKGVYGNEHTEEIIRGAGSTYILKEEL